VELPPNGSFQFDGKPGHERLLLFLSERSHPELERLACLEAADAAAADALVLKLEQANRRNSRLDKVIHGDYTQISLLSASDDAVLVGRMTLRHESNAPFATVPAPVVDRTPLPPSVSPRIESSVSPAGRTLTEMPVGKTCSRCGREVGLGARVGECCRYCGGVWQFERKVYVNR
jgi:hypothetical protein